MIRVWLLSVPLLVGCMVVMPPAPNPPSPPDNVLPDDEKTVPVVTKATRADICKELADSIDSGHIDTTDDLVRVLQIMQDNGDWTDADSNALEVVLPGLAAEKRVLTKGDSQKLKGVK